MSESPSCFFCGADHDLLVREVGMSFGLGGDHYSFCGSCLRKQTAESFWRAFVEAQGLVFPMVQTDDPDAP
jgi:hypothetical protein